MPARTPRRSTVLGLLVAALAVVLTPRPPQSVAADNSWWSLRPLTSPRVPRPADGPRGDQPQLVSTGTGTFQKSLGYFFVALLAGGSLYAVCRTSHRT